MLVSANPATADMPNPCTTTRGQWSCHVGKTIAGVAIGGSPWKKGPWPSSRYAGEWSGVGNEPGVNNLDPDGNQGVSRCRVEICSRIPIVQLSKREKTEHGRQGREKLSG